MIIYGVALLAGCLLIGKILGTLIGLAIGVESDVGGVGIAMLLLVFCVQWLHDTGRLDERARRGVGFWSALYIPIVVAMAASQNVIGAVTGGPLALVGGLIVVTVSFALVPVIARLGKGKYAASIDELEARNRMTDGADTDADAPARDEEKRHV